MPAPTDGQHLIQIGNNIITALNELASKLSTLDGETPVDIGAILGDIENNIESLEATLEARSVAETVALNTNFDTLSGVIQALRLVCCTRVNVSVGFYSMADLPPTDPGTEFSDPPVNFSPTDEPEGTSEWYARKCAIANAIHENYRAWVQSMKDNNVDGMALASISVFSPLLGASLGGLQTDVPVLDRGMVGVVGALVNSALEIFAVLGELDLTQLLTAMDNHAEDLICALYENNNYASALGAYLGVLADNGVSVANRSALSALMIPDVLNHLFYKGDEAVEIALETYNAPYDCFGCTDADCPDYRVIFGSEAAQNGNQITFDSFYLSTSGPAGHWLSIHFGQDTNGDTCGPAKDAKIISINQTSTTNCAYRMSQTHFLAGSGCGNGNWTETNEDWAVAINVQKTGVRTLTLFKAGSTPFQAVVEVT